MKNSRIILVKNLDESNSELISKELSDLKINFRISLENKAVIIEGDNDLAHLVRVTLRENDFIIE